MKFLLLSVLLLMANLSFASDGMINVLKSTSSVEYVYHGLGWQNISIVIIADNCIDKVSIVNQGIELDAIKVKEIENEKTIWEYAKRNEVYSGNPGVVFDFSVVGVTRNGDVYIDNNNSHKYSLYPNDGTYLGPELNVSSRYSYIGQDHYINSYHGYVGKIDIKNIAYKKDVKVHYTLDGWETSSIVNARYQYGYHNGMYDMESPNRFDVELWEFYIKGENFQNLPRPSQLEYAISYEVDGEIFWDNNFGSNYIINIH